MKHSIRLDGGMRWKCMMRDLIGLEIIRSFSLLIPRTFRSLAIQLHVNLYFRASYGQWLLLANRKSTFFLELLFPRVLITLTFSVYNHAAVYYRTMFASIPFRT